VSPGYCWPFQTSRSQLVIRLPARVQPTAITVQHPLKKSSALGDISSAPRDFTVSVSLCQALGTGRWGKAGADEEGEEETLLGTFSYDIEKEPTQTFPLQVDELPRAFRFIRLVVRSTWGKSGYICISRVQVHGNTMGKNAIGQ
ncbi:SUN2 protein, partial [Spizaetus tyrannus]|nr:SUN2 protein [Spizaetus tyrannus]